MYPLGAVFADKHKPRLSMAPVLYSRPRARRSIAAKIDERRKTLTPLQRPMAPVVHQVVRAPVVAQHKELVVVPHHEHGYTIEQSKVVQPKSTVLHHDPLTGVAYQQTDYHHAPVGHRLPQLRAPQPPMATLPTAPRPTSTKRPLTETRTPPLSTMYMLKIIKC
ncbi:hypothetical protein HPB48_004429 [Haemaphysalis longicornis]|uniref:Uncharacterized protein n=1 Tax=Haemaphysalis longicornis TaxID=44386 RepID=A0A9J6FS51_HAELO|nr:hypothetical protein HPB48_004429 [Haemaphysalis longicornis]